jgi:PPOX class probable F420-dependent enzyme
LFRLVLLEWDLSLAAALRDRLETNSRGSGKRNAAYVEAKERFRWLLSSHHAATTTASLSPCPRSNGVHRIAMSASAGFSVFEGHKYLSLETFKKNGQGVRTPIWFAADPEANSAKLYIYTVDNTGKVKRIRNNPRVRIAPCDMRGKILGEWIDATAEIVTKEEAVRGMRLLNKRYFPLKQILGFFALFSRQPRLVIALRPG